MASALLSPAGRLTRGGFLAAGGLSLLGFTFIVGLMSFLTQELRADDLLMPFLACLVAYFVVFWIFLCAVSRRLNDMAASKYLMLLLFVPLANFALFVWLVFAGSRSSDTYVEKNRLPVILFLLVAGLFAAQVLKVL